MSNSILKYQWLFWRDKATYDLIFNAMLSDVILIRSANHYIGFITFLNEW